MPKVNQKNKTKKSQKTLQASLAMEHGNCSKDLKKEPEKFSLKVVKTQPSDVKINKKCSRKDILDEYEVIIEQPGHANKDEPLMDPISLDVKTEPMDDEVETEASDHGSVVDVKPPAVGQGVVTCGGGGASRRGRGGRQQRPGPSKIQQLVIRDISEHPLGHALETPLHHKAKRRRTQRQTSSPAPAPCLPSSSPSTSTAVPSSATFMECEKTEAPPSLLSASPTPPPTRRIAPRRYPTDGEIDCFMGSDESDESGDEEVLAYSGIPRVFQSVMETPLDQDTLEDPTSTADPKETADPAPVVEPAGDPAPAQVPPTSTDQPRTLYEFDWRAFPNPQIPPELRRETFSQSNVGPTTPYGDPYDIFIDIWDRQFMEHIASETNKYAQQLAGLMFDNHSLRPNSRIGHWYDTTPDELYVYFAIVLAMGVVVKSRLDEYWSAARDIFYTPGFSAYMSIDRFLLLSKCIHFNDNNDMYALELDYSEARLFKIEPVLSHLNKKFQEMYTPSQNISLDESLLMWKGWLEISQLIPNKTANRGIKTYEICESQTGYLWRFEVHAHKKSTPQLYEDVLEASTPSIVLRMIKGLEHKGYTLWMDSFYNSPCLARRLKCLGFDCVGTLRTDRKFVPQALHSLTKGNMAKDQITGLTSGDVDVMVWRDNNRVAMISTYHGSGQQTVRGSTKPILILDYNIMMGGVDKKDQLLAMFPIERKRTSVWYKKLFRRLLNVSVLNAYIIHRHSSTLSHRNFRIRLIKSLLARHSTSPPIPTTPKQNKPVDLTHRLAEFPMGRTQRQRRRCVHCKKLVGTFCIGCSKTVCIPCFPKIHS